jgi:hypothetical protein
VAKETQPQPKATQKEPKQRKKDPTIQTTKKESKNHGKEHIVQEDLEMDSMTETNSEGEDKDQIEDIDMQEVDLPTLIESMVPILEEEL